MTKTIDTRKFTARMKSLIASCDEWYDKNAGAEAKAHLEAALKEWKKGWKRRDLNRVGEPLAKAATIEQNAVLKNHNAQFDEFYGPNPRFYTGFVDVQKRQPQSAVIFALMQDVATLHAIQNKLLGDAKPSGHG